MASYTNINGVKLISTGDEAGTWGTSTNTNLEILDAAAKGFKKITMTDADYTLPLDNNPSAVENGHYAGIEFSGANSAERTITLEQNDHALVYLFLNNSGDVLRIKQGDGTGGGNANAGTITISDGASAVVFADGAGTNAKVVDLTAVMEVDSAVKLANARNFSLTGDVTASAVSFDGTGNVALSTAIAAGTIVNADINSSAAIADSKLATISTASKVSNSATTATDANTASAIVARDASGNFSAGTITASLTGNASGTAGSLASAQNFSLTGDVTATAVSFNGTGAVALSTAIAAGAIVNADISDSAAIADSKLDTISTASKVSNSATTADSANTASAIVARDASGNFSAGTITAALSGNATTATSATSASTAAALTGDVSVTGDFTVEATTDIYLKPTGDNVYMQGVTSGEQINFELNGSSQEIIASDALNVGATGGDLTLYTTTSGDVDLNPASGKIGLFDNGTEQAGFDVNTTGQLKVYTGSNFGTLNTTFSGDDITVAGDASVGNDIKMTAGDSDWVFEIVSNKLVIKYGGTSKMELDTSGNLKVTGDITAFGTIS